MVLSYFNYLQKVQKGLWKGTHCLSTARRSMCSCLAPTNTHFTSLTSCCAEQEGLWACKEQLCRGFNVLLPRRSQFRPPHPLDCKIMIKKVWQLSCEDSHWLWVGFERGCITCLRYSPLFQGSWERYQWHQEGLTGAQLVLTRGFLS